MRSVVDVFVEDHCNACDNVLLLLQSSFKGRIDLNVFHRTRHQEVFRNRRILICPATFVDRKLAFYGEFSERDLLSKIA